ncbi:MAG TPA: hypothetical protein VFN35_25380 [Ktedonobacteraceae bacterium]|nr:hypothetical protein [Ktedonobacteraceae bacterium]
MPKQEGDEQQQAEASNPTTIARRLEDLSASSALRSIVAGNPAAPPHLLAQLALDQDKAVRQAVASNPTTPWKILERLAWEFPHEFLHNPVGPLQMFMDPGQICTDERFWHALLREASIPSLWWSWLTGHPALRASRTLRLHTQSAGETSHPFGILQQEDEYTLLTLVELLTVASTRAEPLSACQPKLPYEPTLREYLLRLACSTDETIRAAVASHVQMPVETLHILAVDISVRVRKRVAENIRAPLKVLHSLAQDQEQEVRYTVARNPQAPPEVLRALAQDHYRLIRLAVAQHRQTPSEVLQRLNRSEREEWLVREAVARNPRTPPEVLQRLARNKDKLIRAAVVGNPQVPVEVLHVLAQDKNWVVASAVAEKAWTPPEVLQALAQDKDIHLRGIVARNPRTPPEILQILALDQEQQAFVAENTQAPVEVLRTLAEDRRSWVRRRVAENPRTPAETLQMLALDQEREVRQDVARNPQAPAEVLRTLARDQSSETRNAVATNLRTPVEVLQSLTNDDVASIRWIARLAEWLLLAGDGWINDETWSGLRWNRIDPIPGHPLLRGILADQWEMLGGPELPEIIRLKVMAALVELWDTSTIWSKMIAEGNTSDRKDWDWIAARDAWRVYYRHIMSTSTSPQALQRLALSPSWEVRYLVALHEHTPRETRQRLSQDGNRYVRAMARSG